jgi:hypothetical protein
MASDRSLIAEASQLEMTIISLAPNGIGFKYPPYHIVLQFRGTFGDVIDFYSTPRA